MTTFYSKVPSHMNKLIQGYVEIPTYRTLMAYLYEQSRDRHEEVKLDGVGTYPPSSN